MDGKRRDGAALHLSHALGLRADRAHAALDQFNEGPAPLEATGEYVAYMQVERDG
jgi:hypothetical protein